ncbi:MAG: protein kinase [Polyangiaceae bacterium]
MSIRGSNTGDEPPVSSTKPTPVGAPTPKPTVPSMRRPTPPPHGQARRVSSTPPPRRPAIYFPPSAEAAPDATDDESPPTVPRRRLPSNAVTATSLEAVHAKAQRVLGSVQPPPAQSAQPTGYTMPPPPPPVSKLSELGEQLVGATFAERYHVIRIIGRGSNSIVFAAEAAGSRLEPTPIALKVLDPALHEPTAALARLHTEVRALQILASENVTRVYDVGIASAPRAPNAAFSETAVPFIAMELLEGRDLRTVLLEHGPLGALDVVEILQQVALVLERAHGLGIVHRDLKPANLFVVQKSEGDAHREEGSFAGQVLVKVLDFGVASLTEPPPDDSIPSAIANTTSRGFFGTPWYMAPEQIAGGPITPAIDVWALGLIAFRLLTKESYWPPRPIGELLAEIVAGPRLLPTDVVEIRRLAPRARLGENFDAWFMRSCEIGPADRFRSAVEQITALAHALERDR